MTTQIISLLLAIFRAVPPFRKWWDELVSSWVANQITDMKVANIEGIRKAIYEFDQRELEKVMGNPNAGKEVPQPDSEIVDHVPGVP